MTDPSPVLIVGAGLAGLACATRLAAGGAKVLVLEASEAELYPCNSRFSGGLFHIAMDDMVAPEAEILARVAKATDGAADPALTLVLARKARPALEWLRSCGVTFMKAGPDGLRKFSLTPPRVRRTGLYWRGRCGDVMLRQLESFLLAKGGQILRGHRAEELLMQGHRCTGLRISHQGEELEIFGQAVVLCDGGFQANPELVGKYLSPAPERLLMRNAKSGVGAGLRMAQQQGAALRGIGSFYGHIHHRDAVETEMLWPFPVLDALCCAGIMVDAAGKRFADEGQGGVYCANMLAKLPDPLGAWVIFDQAIWQGPGRDWLLPANPYLLSAGRAPVQAASLAELAAKTGLPQAELEQTLAQYHAGLAGQIPLSPAKSAKIYPPQPINLRDLYALPLSAGLTYTSGGLAISPQAEVLRESQQPIAGLYAAGASTGGLEGGAFHGYIGGLSKAAIFGLIAAETILQGVGEIRPR